MATFSLLCGLLVFNGFVTSAVLSTEEHASGTVTQASFLNCDECWDKITAFKNHSVCRKLKDALDCLGALDESCYQAYYDHYEYYDADYDTSPTVPSSHVDYPAESRPADAHHNVSTPDLFQVVADQYAQACTGTAGPGRSSNGSPSMLTSRVGDKALHVLILSLFVSLKLCLCMEVR